MRWVAMWSGLFIVAGCSSAVSVACDGDEVCAKYGARCLAGLCRIEADLGVAGDAASDVTPGASGEDAGSSLASPDLLDPADLAPGCTTAQSCGVDQPVCGAEQVCRACVAGDRAVCAGRSILSPRCDETTGACAACRVAAAAIDCPEAALGVCGSDGSCRQACTQHGDCASGICDPQILTVGQASCARVDEVVHVRSDSACVGAHAGTLADPVCTIDDALAKRPDGGFIRLHGGDRTEPRVETLITKPYVIVGSVQISAPDEMVAGLAVHTSAFMIGSGGRAYIEGVHVLEAHGSGILCTGGGKLVLVGSVIDGASPAGISAVDCDLSLNRVRVQKGRYGLMHDGGSIRVTNTFITDNTGVGLTVSSRSTEDLFAYLTIASNVPSTTSTPGALSCGAGITLRNSIVWGNLMAGGKSYAGSCAFRASSVDSAVAGVGNTLSAPSFTPGIPLRGIFTDYHLQSELPIGENIASVQDDYDGQTRPLGTGYDVGADEL